METNRRLKKKSWRWKINIVNRRKATTELEKKKKETSRYDALEVKWRKSFKENIMSTARDRFNKIKSKNQLSDLGLKVIAVRFC